MLTIHFLSLKEWLVIQSCVYFSTYKMNCQLKTTNILLLYFTDLFYSFYFMTHRLKSSSCCMWEFFFSMTLNTTEVMRHFLSNFHNICSYNICLSYLSGIQIDAIDLLIISVLRQQRKYSSERKNKGNNKERVFRSINSQCNMCYVRGLWAKIHMILSSLFKRLMEIFLDNMQLLKFLSKVKLLQLYKYYESI